MCEEQPREGYDRDAFGSAYSSLEDDIIDMLPPTMRAGGQVYTPYSCLAFNIRADGTAATDIEHIVALAEAHDSGIADDRRRDIAADLDNLTIADPQVNRTEKSDRDAGGGAPGFRSSPPATSEGDHSTRQTRAVCFSSLTRSGAPSTRRTGRPRRGPGAGGTRRQPVTSAPGRSGLRDIAQVTMRTPQAPPLHRKTRPSRP